MRSSVIGPKRKSTRGSSGTFVMSDDNRLSTMMTHAGSCSSSLSTRLEPTKPAPPTTRIVALLTLSSLMREEPLSWAQRKDRKSVVEGKRVLGSEDPGGGRIN